MLTVTTPAYVNIWGDSVCMEDVLSLTHRKLPLVLFLALLVSLLAATTINPGDVDVRRKFQQLSRRPLPLFDRTLHEHVIENYRCNLCQCAVWVVGRCHWQRIRLYHNLASHGHTNTRSIWDNCIIILWYTANFVQLCYLNVGILLSRLISVVVFTYPSGYQLQLSLSVP